ncbi:unnamed protein product [Prunus armeniaca]
MSSHPIAQKDHLRQITHNPPHNLPKVSSSPLRSMLNSSFCFMMHLASKRILGMGKQVNRLYYLIKKENITTAPSTSNATTCHLNPTFAALWHQRLGHPSKEPSKYYCS